MSDPNWNKGFYYDGPYPRLGMKHARSVVLNSLLLWKWLGNLGKFLVVCFCLLFLLVVDLHKSYKRWLCVLIQLTNRSIAIM